MSTPSQISIRSNDLTAQLSKPSNPLAYAYASLEPAILLFMMVFYGLVPAVREQFGSKAAGLIGLINPFRWGRLILGHGLSALLGQAAQMNQGIKRALLSLARGRVLEVGAGSGENVKFYEPDEIERLFCLEPFDTLRVKLEANLIRSRLHSKATIIPAGLTPDRSSLTAASITASSIDTIVLVQVLCSIPNPRSHLEYLQSLLKPGGQILLYEHVGSKDSVARTVQRIWNPVWTRCAGGCEIVRDSAEWLEELGGWEKVEVQYPVAENSASLYPHVVARFVKSAT
ncbi:hypothetical protein DFJ73DRAFT_824602 [Zopfochytrium polystomum]|nr:hypothetical protein DFJ73DRAFT_824602 [Zopfochytrium polystomum]